MKKLILPLIFSLSFLQVQAIEDLQPIGISKYAVLETLDNNTPLRLKDNENAPRATHLYKNTVLFADKQNKNYYRVELKKDSYAWVNKKLVEIQAIIPEKRFDNIEKITFQKDKKNNIVKIDTQTKSAFVLKEQGTNLDFTLFDNYFDPIETKVSNKSDNFKMNDTFSSELNLKYINPKPLFGYNVENSDKGYILKIKKPPQINPKKPLKNIVVVVDPGHGGNELGACAFDLQEKTINLEISKKLKRELQKRGAKVYLTRTKDKKTGLYQRVDFALEKKADILLSIHQNSLANRADVSKKHGVGTYYYHNQSKPLAQSIQDNLLEATNFKDDKVNYASFALTRPSAQLSVLVECGYIIYEEEAKKLADKKFQKIIAKAIVKGCEDYLKKSF